MYSNQVFLISTHFLSQQLSNARELEKEVVMMAKEREMKARRLEEQRQMERQAKEQADKEEEERKKREQEDLQRK